MPRSKPVPLDERPPMRGRSFLAFPACSLLLSAMLASAPDAAGGTRENLQDLRNRCLYFAMGRAPADAGVQTIRHGLWAQGPFSPAGEIDLAASGFALAALPCAVTNGLLTHAQGYALASNAAHAVRALVQSAAASSNATTIGWYGYRGMLFHYYVWSDANGEFRGQGSEISSVDTTLLLFGLLVAAQFFGGSVLADYTAARDLIDWPSWLDPSPGLHQYQFRMAYQPGVGFQGWWDWYTHETMLIAIFAAMSTPSLEPMALCWAWRRDPVVYVSPEPNAKQFSCYATWNGDPFAVYYGLLFLPFQSFPRRGDVDGVNWFEQARTSYFGHVEFFKRERGYLDNMVYSYFAGAGGGAIAKPKSSPDAPTGQVSAPVHAIAGGLSYYSPTPASNELAQTLSALVASGSAFYGWHGWPPATVIATGAHAVASDWIVGQDICATALAIENYLNTGTVQRLALGDARLRGVLTRIWPPAAVDFSASAGPLTADWQAVPYGQFLLSSSTNPPWWSTSSGPVSADGDGHVQTVVSPSGRQSLYRIETSDP
jgi:hypothetical protein